MSVLLIQHQWVGAFWVAEKGQSQFTSTDTEQIVRILDLQAVTYVIQVMP
jgi:hypothetical protein